MPTGVYKRSKEQLAKHSAAMMGNQNAKGHSAGKGHPGQIPWNKGRHYPKKVIQRMSAITKAWWDKKKAAAKAKADEGRIHWSRKNILHTGNLSETNIWLGIPTLRKRGKKRVNNL